MFCVYVGYVFCVCIPKGGTRFLIHHLCAGVDQAEACPSGLE